MGAYPLRCDCGDMAGPFARARAGRWLCEDCVERASARLDRETGGRRRGEWALREVADVVAMARGVLAWVPEAAVRFAVENPDCFGAEGDYVAAVNKVQLGALLGRLESVLVDIGVEGMG